MSAYDRYASLPIGTELIYESGSFFTTRSTPDGRYMAMSSSGAMLLIPDPETGIPSFPTVSMLNDAQREHRLFIRSDPLDNPVRAAARAEGKTPAEVIADDHDAPSRKSFLRAWDAMSDEEKPMRTNDGLPAFAATVFGPNADGSGKAGSTYRCWINERGRAGNRRMSDMESRSGKVPRRRKIHPVVLAIAKLHALGVAKRAKRRSFKTGYILFERDVARANKGQAIDIDGITVDYERQSSPLKPFGREIFRLECHRAKSKDTDKAAWGEKGARAIYRGGGKAKEPSRFLEIVEQDDTPFPKWFIIDLEKRVPVGEPTAVFTMDVFSRAIIGWDVSYESPSISTWMRALSHSVMPKEIPLRFRESHPGLADIGGFITGCALYDNALQYISKAVEDAGGDLCHEVRLAGEGEATHKNHVERAHQTVQTMMRELPGTTFDIALMRKYGYNPVVHTLVTIEEFRAVLAEAIATYHTTPSDALNGRTPLDVWQEQIRLYGLGEAKDVDQFLRAIGDIDYYTFGRSGTEIDGLTYSNDDGDDPGNSSLLADLGSKLGPSKDPANPRFEVKVKSYPNDLGFISVWNPQTRRYVDIPCTRQRYAAGKPKWLHERIKDHAALVGKSFITEDQMLEIQAGFIDIIGSTAPEASARERRTMAKVIDAPNVRRYLGDALNVIRVKPSPSGLENIVQHDLRSETRKDDMVKMPRSKRGGANVERDRRDTGKEHSTAKRLAERARSTPTQRSGRSSKSRSGVTVSRKKTAAAAAPLPVAKFR